VERSILEKLGVPDLDTVTKALAAAKVAEEAGKTAAQKATELEASLKTTQSEAERLKAVTSSQADQMMAVLTPEQQTAVKALAGDDKAKQLQTISALSSTWSVPVPTPPVNTAPGRTAPSSDPLSPPDYRSTYESLRQTNPFAAAALAAQHNEVYFPKT
jgi:hypothetical protein